MACPLPGKQSPTCLGLQYIASDTTGVPVHPPQFAVGSTSSSGCCPPVENATSTWPRARFSPHPQRQSKTCAAWRTCCSVAARASKCCALSSASRASRLSLSRSTCSKPPAGLEDQASMRKQGSSTDALGRERVRECRDFDLECLRLRSSSFRLPCPQHRRTHTSCSPSIQCGGMRTQCLAERLELDVGNDTRRCLLDIGRRG